MTTKDAVQVARIMYHHNLHASRPIAAFLMAFPEVNLVEFFNETDSFLDEGTHDNIMRDLEFLRNSEKASKSRHGWSSDPQTDRELRDKYGPSTHERPQER